MLTLGSLFAGIGGFDLAFSRHGFRSAWQVEIDRDANRVLVHHWRDVPQHEDVAAVGRRNLPRVDVIVGGFPCQDLSVAGKRTGLGGERSGLFYEMTRVVHELRPAVLVWENVPGLLSSRRGHDFLAALTEMDRIGYSGAWRTLDARHFGVPQRRRRVFGVFVKGHSGGRRAAEILALAEGCGGDSQAGREAAADVAGTLGGCTAGAGWGGDPDRAGAYIANAVTPGQRRASANRANENLVTHALTSQGHDASEDGTGRGTPLVAASLRSRQSNPGVNPPGRGGEDDQNLVYQCHGSNVGPMGTLRAGNGNEGGGVPFMAVAAFGGNRTSSPIDVSTALNACKTASGRQDFETETFIVNAAESCAVERHARPSDVARCLDQTDGFASGQGGTVAVVPILESGKRGGASSRASRDGSGIGRAGSPMFTHGTDSRHAIQSGMMVRRLTPTECARLQGFPDDWLDLDPPLSDSAKYRLLGNAVAIPVVEWIGRRLTAVLSRAGLDS